MDTAVSSEIGDCEISIQCCITKADETDNSKVEKISLCSCFRIRKNRQNTPEMKTGNIETVQGSN